jgi:hypothetical protein
MATIDSAPWRKSSYSGTNGGSCVEAADVGGSILVRDTTDRGGLVLSIPPDVWRRFTTTLRQCPPDLQRRPEMLRSAASRPIPEEGTPRLPSFVTCLISRVVRRKNG